MPTPIQFTSKSANPDMPEVSDITAEDLNSHAEQVCIIDVRRPDEYVGELGHIAKSKNLVMNTLPDVMDEMPMDQTIVFVCRSGSRSARASSFLLESGYTNVYNLKGGMLRWNELKLPVVRS